MKQAAIVCENLTFRYFEKSKPVIDNVSLTIPAGEITVLMGSSGCGKSTLAAILCGLLPENGGFLTEGSVELFGTPLKELNPSKRAEKREERDLAIWWLDAMRLVRTKELMREKVEALIETGSRMPDAKAPRGVYKRRRRRSLPEAAALYLRDGRSRR